MRSQSRLGYQASEAPLEQFESVPGRIGAVAHRLPGLLLLVLGMVMVRHLLATERFQVKVVEVTGTRMLAPDQVRESVGLLGDSVFGVNESTIERALLDQYACLEGARVRCRLPATCRVSVSEIAEVLVWEQGGEAWWVSLEGRVLGPAAAVSDAPRLVNSGSRLEPRDGYLVGVPWLYAYEASLALAGVYRLEYLAGYGLLVRMGAEGMPVYLGAGGDVATKLELAADVIAEAERRALNITYIDLRSTSRPVVGGL
ncbi:MAG: FtsQ-type POTRA domain-containing protein [Chloroflexi bacterium]|nr:FtsQ-type POTRA domain-containing protein [Chloroflexota bacterium]